MPTAQPRRLRASKKAENDPASVVEEAFRAAVAARRVAGVVPASLFERRRKRAQGRIREALEARGGGSVRDGLPAEIRALAQKWAEHDFEDGFDEAEAFEIRCFEEHELVAAERSGDQERIYSAAETKHRSTVVREYGEIEIRGLQMSARVYQSLDVVYVPLHVQDDSSQGEVLRVSEGIEVRAIPRLSVPELLAKHERSVIVGAPGSGKTTLVAYLASQAAAHRLHKDVGWEKSPVPFAVAVRSLSEARLDEHVIAELSGCDPAFVRWVLDAKRGVVLVDGLDEARAGAAEWLAPIAEFVERFPGNRIVITTRPAGDRASERADIPGFLKTTLLPMTREEVYLFIERWCRAAELKIQKDPKRAELEAERAAEDLKSRVQTSRPVERLAETPLLCSVLCIVHRFLGQRIPERRAALYEACTNVLLYEWDRAKFQNGSSLGQLDAQDKRFLLSGLSHSMHEKHAAEVTAEEVVSHFAERLPFIKRPPEEARSLVREIQDRSGLLVERRPGVFAFSHLAFQEYLTAVKIVHTGALKNLVRKHADRWWHEVIALAAGLPGADAATLIRGLLKADKHAASTGAILAAHCMETAIDLPVSLRQEVETRLAMLVPPRTDEDVDRLVAVGDVVAPVLLRALDGADADATARIAVTFGRLGYEPATGALIQLLSDMRTTGEDIRVTIGDWLITFSDSHPVATILLATLASLSIRSMITRSAFEHAFMALDSDLLANLLDLANFVVNDETPRARVEHHGAKYFDELRIKVSTILLEKSRPKRPARSG